MLGVAGQVDLRSLPVLRTALAEVIGRRSDHVIVDLAAVRFCSVRGLTVLAEAGATAAGAGPEYAIGGESRLVNRMWALGWPDAELPIPFPTGASEGFSATVTRTGPPASRGRPRRSAIQPAVSPTRSTPTRWQLSARARAVSDPAPRRTARSRSRSWAGTTPAGTATPA